MDDARYNELVAKNAQLAEELKTLESQQLARDPNYVPAGVDPDLMYSDDAAKQDKEEPGFAWGTFFLWTLGLSFAGILVWMIFFRKADYD